MGVEYYCVCNDCKKYTDLNKIPMPFQVGNSVEFSDANIDVELSENLEYYQSEGFLFRMLRVFRFMSDHKGHRIQLMSEFDFDYGISAWIHPEVLNESNLTTGERSALQRQKALENSEMTGE